MNNSINRFTPHEEIDHIFGVLLPDCGLTVRSAQTKLCHDMFDAMQGKQIALCDAGTGIGKTYAYLIAGFVFHKHGQTEMPILISTSSIALQKAIITEYIPFLSEVLTKAGLAESPVLAVVRKGKSHYACDKRLTQRISKANMDRKNIAQRKALYSLRSILDMDGASHLSEFDRTQVCVDCCRGCSLDCRYREFIKQSKSPEYTFQVCNHNFLLADAMHRNEAIAPLLPECCAVILDEAHKLPGAARQMFSLTLSQSEMKAAIKGLHQERYTLAYAKLHDALKPIMGSLDAVEFPEDAENAEYPMWSERKKLFTAAEKTIASICRVLDKDISDGLMFRLERILKVISLFKACSETHIRYASIMDDENIGLCATASNIEWKLRSILWDNGSPFILTSGTLAVGNDFLRFKSEVGLLKSRRQIVESVSLSPFDYNKNCLLYVPNDAAAPSEDENEDYLAYLAERIGSLVHLSHGRTLVLFTSYALMSEIYARLEAQSLPYPLFPVRKNANHTIGLFKESNNGVLLGTGALWEGVDFPGDMVSQIIIPRLPFAVPDPVSEKQRQQYISLKDYIKAVVLPNMQIKLRQGFGRAIRTETDTCIVSVLDDRAMRGHRYHAALRNALPEMGITASMNTTARFIHNVKPESYFTEV